MTSATVSRALWLHAGFCVALWSVSGWGLFLVASALIAATNLAMFHTHKMNEGE